MEKVGSEVALWQVPARPVCAAGSYLHAKLAWHLGTVYRSPGIFFVEARSLVSDAPTWNKRSSELLVVTCGAFACSGEESDKKAPTRKVVECASSLIEPLRAATRILFCFQGEGAPELHRCVVSAGTSGH